MIVQHNITAMNANRMLGLTTGSLAKSTEKLSSGYKINRAADDAAGLSISEKMRKQIRGLSQASTNAEDGISCVQTAEGALNEIHSMLQRMNELAVQASNGTNSQSDRQARISKYAEMFEIKNALAQTIDGYSHGMKQKLAIVSALIHNPKLIIMDEPFVGLDPKSSHLLKTLMREMCDNGGAIFFSTHVLEVAEKLCDKVAIIKSGKLIKSGTMDEVKGDDSLEDVFLELEEKDA